MFRIAIFRARGQSMAPGIRDGSLVVVRLGREPHPGEVGVFRHPANGLPLLKRVTAAEDDGLEIAGDNAAWSEDSRDFGRVDRSLVIGKAVLVI